MNYPLYSKFASQVLFTLCNSTSSDVFKCFLSDQNDSYEITINDHHFRKINKIKP